LPCTQSPLLNCCPQNTGIISFGHQMHSREIYQVVLYAHWNSTFHIRLYHRYRRIRKERVPQIWSWSKILTHF
jgi:hypothetical protein